MHTAVINKRLLASYLGDFSLYTRLKICTLQGVSVYEIHVDKSSCLVAGDCNLVNKIMNMHYSVLAILTHRLNTYMIHTSTDLESTPHAISFSGCP